jgi:hypothetical protein
MPSAAPRALPLWRGPSIAPSLRGSCLFITMPRGGTRQAEEVRDGSHANNRGSGNRCGVAPTAASLRPLDWAGVLRGSSPFVFSNEIPIENKSCSGPDGATMTVPGARAQLRMRRSQVLVLGAPASLIRSELSHYGAPTLSLSVCFPPGWVGICAPVRRPGACLTAGLPIPQAAGLFLALSSGPMP